MSEAATPRTNLYLIRHGESYANVEPIIGGMKGDKGLTARGIEQAERLRDRLRHSAEIAADVFIASTLPRARQTAEIIAPAIGLPIVYDDAVQELRPGDSDGLTFATARERYGMVNIEQQPRQAVSPNGESWATFALRVATTLDHITREYAGKTIVIVTHGGFIDATFVYFLNLPTLTMPPILFHTRNTSITHWIHQREAGARQWLLSTYNDDAHLHGLEAQDFATWQERVNKEAPAEPLPSVVQADC